MPNETSNLLEIYGDNNEVLEFINLHKKNNPDDINTYYWDFEESVPINDEYYKKNSNLNNLSNEDSYKIISLRNKNWGTNRGLIIGCKENIVYIDTPWTPCKIWFKQIIVKYPNLNFILKYNDEYREEYYGWVVASKGEIIGEEEVCLHIDKERGGVNLYKNI